MGDKATYCRLELARLRIAEKYVMGLAKSRIAIDNIE